jgi:signal transduction histidine kinase
VFAAVVDEVGGLLGVDYAGLSRYESDGSTMPVLALWGSKGGALPPAGEGQLLGGRSLSTIVFETGRAARIDGHPDAAGQLGLEARVLGIGSGVGAPIVVEGHLWGLITVYSAADQPLSADTEARLASFTDIVATAIANAETRAQIAASRARVVAAADDTRRRIERDLHDGAQQRLVSLGLELRAAQAEMPAGLSALKEELSRVAEGLTSVQDELREFARGIHPAILAQGGLEPALKTLARRSTIAVELDVRAPPRLPERVEVAAYYVVSEALTNAAKHAGASVVHVQVRSLEDVLRLSVRDDGAGGADPLRGSGLVGLQDRVEALGGRISIESPLGAGTVLEVELPLERRIAPEHV